MNTNELFDWTKYRKLRPLFFEYQRDEDATLSDMIYESRYALHKKEFDLEYAESTLKEKTI